jgi:CDP-paratose 2-epimerase
MKIIITGICGFVGSSLAKALIDDNNEIIGIDNFCRAGSWLNKEPLQKLGIQIIYGDIRNASDVDTLPKADWLIDAAANPSVLAGIDGKTSSRQLIEHNLQGTVNILEYCKRHQAGFTLLSTSRVYSIEGLSHLSVKEVNGAFQPLIDQNTPTGITAKGVTENYSTQPPVSLYGSTKLASEHLALEYGYTFDFPVWINRSGVLAGASQFGHPTQGIFAFWIHSFREKRPLKYIGFGGQGYQVRDCLHPRDIVPLLQKQFSEPLHCQPRIVNLSSENSMSLRQLSEWCESRFGPNKIDKTTEERPFDIPWMVLDHTLASETWNWQPKTPINEILTEIANFADSHPDWLSISQR